MTSCKPDKDQYNSSSLSGVQRVQALLADRAGALAQAVQQFHCESRCVSATAARRPALTCAKQGKATSKARFSRPRDPFAWSAVLHLFTELVRQIRAGTVEAVRSLPAEQRPLQNQPRQHG